MPIRRELRGLYPAHWRELSRRVRFERAGGVCQGCGRPHGSTVRCLPDGLWYDSDRQTWRDQRGRTARWPDLERMTRLRTTRVVLAAAHLDHDPTHNRLRNLRSLCQRCHMIHDRPHHLAQRRITYLLRCALGDLFLGPYGSEHPTPAKRLGARRLTGRLGVRPPLHKNAKDGKARLQPVLGIALRQIPLPLQYAGD